MRRRCRHPVAGLERFNGGDRTTRCEHGGAVVNTTWRPRRGVVWIGWTPGSPRRRSPPSSVVSTHDLRSGRHHAVRGWVNGWGHHGGERCTVIVWIAWIPLQGAPSPSGRRLGVIYTHASPASSAACSSDCGRPEHDRVRLRTLNKRTGGEHGRLGVASNSAYLPQQVCSPSCGRLMYTGSAHSCGAVPSCIWVILWSAS